MSMKFWTDFIYAEKFVSFMIINISSDFHFWKISALILIILDYYVYRIFHWVNQAVDEFNNFLGVFTMVEEITENYVMGRILYNYNLTRIFKPLLLTILTGDWISLCSHFCDYCRGMTQFLICAILFHFPFDYICSLGWLNNWIFLFLFSPHCS